MGSAAAVEAHALPLAELEDAFSAAEAGGGGAGLEGGDWSAGSGGLSPAQGVWCAAGVAGTNLHCTLVPPPNSREGDEPGRRAALGRLRAKHGHPVVLHVATYHIAERAATATAHAEALPRKAKGHHVDKRRGAEGGGGSGGVGGGVGAKKVGFWEVEAVEGLAPGEGLASQARAYHITDVGSLGQSTKAAVAYEVLASVLKRTEGGAESGAEGAPPLVTPEAVPAVSAAPAAPAAGGKGFAGTCNKCGLRGHKMKDCPGPSGGPRRAGAGVPGGGGGKTEEEVFQVQVEIHSDDVFYSWPLHARAGGCAPLYRGMVVQFDGVCQLPGSPRVPGGEQQQQQQLFGIAVVSMKILGIAKLKCLNYLWRTFGVRNQLPCLLNDGVDAYVARCKNNFFRNW